MLGRVVNALGQPIDGKGPINTNTFDQLRKLLMGLFPVHQLIHQCRPDLKVLTPWYLLAGASVN
jgi:F0F1-type ATP synthase alpha subunit